MGLHSEFDQYTSLPIWRRLFIVTGGQTGTDRAAMDFAKKWNLALSGWCPKNRLAEDGPIDAMYPLQETCSEDPDLRTELNAFDSDGTLILNQGKPIDGTNLTAKAAIKYQKPLLIIELEEARAKESKSMFRNWILNNDIRILNIAGPRESHKPGFIYSTSFQALNFFFS